MVKAKDLIRCIAHNIGRHIIIFEISGFGIKSPRDNSELDVLQQLALDTCTLAYSLTHL